MVERETTPNEIQQLKRKKILEMPWDCEEGDFLYLFEEDACVCAVIRLSIDPLNNSEVWIDEFEVIREYRKNGIGKSIICEFLNGYTEATAVRIMAKNRKVAEFWYKCGFQYDNDSWDEIPMVYRREH